MGKLAAALTILVLFPSLHLAAQEPIADALHDQQFLEESARDMARTLHFTRGQAIEILTTYVDLNRGLQALGIEADLPLTLQRGSFTKVKAELLAQGWRSVQSHFYTTTEHPGPAVFDTHRQIWNSIVKLKPGETAPFYREAYSLGRALANVGRIYGEAQDHNPYADPRMRKALDGIRRNLDFLYENWIARASNPLPPPVHHRLLGQRIDQLMGVQPRLLPAHSDATTRQPIVYDATPQKQSERPLIAEAHESARAGLRALGFPTPTSVQMEGKPETRAAVGEAYWEWFQLYANGGNAKTLERYAPPAAPTIPGELMKAPEDGEADVDKVIREEQLRAAQEHVRSVDTVSPLTKEARHLGLNLMRLGETYLKHGESVAHPEVQKQLLQLRHDILKLEYEVWEKAPADPFHLRVLETQLGDRLAGPWKYPPGIDPPRTAQPEMPYQTRGGFRDEAVNTGRYIGAYLLKETLKTAATAQSNRMQEAWQVVRTPEFLGSLVVLTATARGVDAILNRPRIAPRILNLPRFSRSMIHSGLPMASGFILWDAIHGRTDVPHALKTTGAFMLAGGVIDRLTARTALPAVLKLRRGGAAALAALQVVKLGAVLESAELLEHAMPGEARSSPADVMRRHRPSRR